MRVVCSLCMVMGKKGNLNSQRSGHWQDWSLGKIEQALDFAQLWAGLPYGVCVCGYIARP